MIHEISRDNANYSNTCINKKKFKWVQLSLMIYFNIISLDLSTIILKWKFDMLVGIFLLS